MRICLYTTTALPKLGGQEMVVDALARHFQALGHEVVVLAPHPRLPLLARRAVTTYPVARHPRVYSTRFGVGLYAWWLLRLKRRFGFDVVHAHGLHPHGWLATRNRDRLGVPVVLTSHGDDLYAGSHRLRCPRIRPRIGHAVTHADHLVAISTFTRNGYLRFGADPRRITLLPNGVEAQALARTAARPDELPAAVRPGRYALFLGRLAALKGVDVLLAALARTPDPGGVDLVVAGAGKERGPLEQRARLLGLAGRVAFVGPVAGATKAYLLQNARCVVVPSKTFEAQSLVVLEAFAAGVPVIASRLRGVADLIDHRRTGWLVPPGDDLALADTLTEAWASHDINAMRARVRYVAGGLDWATVARRHVLLYEDLLGAPRGLRPAAQKPTPSIREVG
jgi:glycosyltransferase involved in cell wall biosynthesis